MPMNESARDAGRARDDRETPLDASACEALAVMIKLCAVMASVLIMSVVLFMRDNARLLTMHSSTNACATHLASENERLRRANAALVAEAARTGADGLPRGCKRRMIPNSFRMLDPDFACVVCLEVLRMPVTQSCGHTMCMTCTRQIMLKSDPGPRCPLCRAPIADACVSVQLRAIVDKFH